MRKFEEAQVSGLSLAKWDENLHPIVGSHAAWRNLTTNVVRALRVEAADLDIKAARKSVQVPLAPYGCVADYVPFYFAPRSPMLYKLHKGGVPNYTGGQDPLVYLVSSA